jgi:hypothetical protein
MVEGGSGKPKQDIRPIGFIHDWLKSILLRVANRQYVNGFERKSRMGMNGALAVVPLDPEVAREAEVDWGSAWVVMAGERRLVKFFSMRSRYSGKSFVRAYPWERQEMFFDAHMRAFSFYGGIFPTRHDNLTVAVRQILRESAWSRIGSRQGASTHLRLDSAIPKGQRRAS